MNEDYKEGFKLGIPIGIGYLCVSFAFGMMVKNASLPVWMAFLISATNMTSAGQFAGLNLIVLQASYAEMALTTLVINLRYALMSLSLSQRLDEKMSTFERCIMAFGVTDEIFAVSLTRTKPITLAYFMGILSPAFVGWTLGSVLGALFSSILPASISNVMNIALYGMFVAIILPAAKQDKKKRLAVILATICSCLMTYQSVIQISQGWMIIFVSVAVSAFMAFFFPIRKQEEM